MILKKVRGQFSSGTVSFALPKVRPVKKIITKKAAQKVRVGLVRSHHQSFTCLESLDGYLLVDIRSQLDFERAVRFSSVDIFFVEDTVEWMDLFSLISNCAKHKNVVLLTNTKQPPVIQSAFQAGVSDVLAIPEDTSEIAKVLRVLI